MKTVYTLDQIEAAVREVYKTEFPFADETTVTAILPSDVRFLREVLEVLADMPEEIEPSE